MGLEDRVSLVLNVLDRAGKPLPFPEIVARADQCGEQDAAFALGALAARKEVGQAFIFDFVVMREADFTIDISLWRDTVLKLLRQGPATFLEIAEQIKRFRDLDACFTFGWLYAEGKIAPLDSESGLYSRWQLVG